MSLENDRVDSESSLEIAEVVDSLIRWAIEPSSWLKVSRSLHFSLIFHKFHFSMMLLLLLFDLRTRSAPTAEQPSLLRRSALRLLHIQRRRFTCKLIFNPNTANSLYGTPSPEQVSSLQLSDLCSQLSFRLVSCFFPFGFCISLPFFDYYANILTIQMTIKAVG